MPASLRFKTKVKKGVLILPKKAKVLNDKIDGTVNGLPFIDGNIKNRSFKLTNIMQKFADDEVTIEILRIKNEEEIRVPSDLTKALKSSPKAKKVWENTTPIARRDWVFWISTAKMEETYKKRIKTTISKLSSGMKRVCCFPGIKWLMEKSGK